MKKYIIIVTILCIFLCGCGKNEIPAEVTSDIPTPTISSTSVTVPKDDSTLVITDTPKQDKKVSEYTTDSGTDYTVWSLPFECPYNDHVFSLDDVLYYSNVIDKNQILYVVLVLNITDIPDDEIDWFIEDTHDKVLTSVYLTNDENDIEFDSLSPIGTFYYTDTKKLCYVYMTSVFKENRYKFDECEIAAVLNVKQKEKYESNGKKYHKSNQIHYYTDITIRDIYSLDWAESNLRHFISKQTNSYLDSVSKNIRDYLND